MHGSNDAFCSASRGSGHNFYTNSDGSGLVQISILKLFKQSNFATWRLLRKEEASTCRVVLIILPACINYALAGHQMSFQSC
jgi:hypothetical protein